MTARSRSSLKRELSPVANSETKIAVSPLLLSEPGWDTHSEISVHSRSAHV